MTLKVGSLFSGAGGLDLGVCDVFDAETVWVCEINKDAAKVLAERFPHAPNIGDISRVDWQHGLYDDGTQDGGDLEQIDILIGGFPCQDVSSAGLRAGIKDGTRSGLWAMFAEAIKGLQPKFIVIENVRGLLSAEASRGGLDAAADSDVESGTAALADGSDGPLLRAAGAVLGDLASLGYDASWRTVSASTWGAPHQRDRVFILAYRGDVTPEDIAEAVRTDRVDSGRLDDVEDLLPTPDAGTFTRGSKHLMLPTIARLAVGDDTVPNPDMAGAPTDLLPTTRATSGRAQGAGYGPMLEDAVFMALRDDRTRFQPGMKVLPMLATPRATDGGSSTENVDKLLSTPRASEPGCAGEGFSAGPADTVEQKLKTLPTPTCSDAKGGLAGGSTGERRAPELASLVEHDLHLLPTPNATEAERGHGGNKYLLQDAARDSVTLLPTPLASGTEGATTEHQTHLPDVACGAIGEFANEHAAKLFPTPTVSDAKTPGDPDECRAAGHNVSLADVVVGDPRKPRTGLLPTPRAADCNGSGHHGDGGPDLRTAIDDAIKLFPTPTASSGQRNGVHPDVRKSYGIGASIVEMVDIATTYGEPEWHQYDGAIKRWEALFRPAPYPVVAGKNEKPQLSARFAEWMMGWPLDWVNIEGLSRRAQLRICGNGVVPQQAAGALRLMLTDLLLELLDK